MRARPYDRAMRLVDELLRLSATDLANHLGCIHLSELNRAAAQGRVRRPRWDDPLGDLLRARGDEHEKAYLAHLRATPSLKIVEIPEVRDGGGADLTAAAMRDGADVIYQAPLGDGRWYGRADFLIKVPRSSNLGSWSYEVTDAKLATETRAGTVLQLCVYSELVAAIQGPKPERAHVVAPHHEFKPEAYRLAEYEAYYRLVKRRLETALDARADDKPAPERGGAPVILTYPEPVQHCEVCSWWARCDAERRADDHLCFVAGISKTQIKELERIRVETLERLGELRDVPKPTRGSREALVKSRDQAAIQLRGRRLDAPQHEILAPLGPEHGLAKLPEPNARDLFLDLEGDRLAPDGGREYLFGYVSERGGYVPLWAATPAEEKHEFERLIDTILAEFRAEPGMHVYHFGAYEPAAMKRLSGRYATRETELDTILRAELFVDLYTIVRHSLRASVESYSIKELEQFYGLDREQDLRAATLSRRAIEWAIEMHEELPIDAAHALSNGTPKSARRPQLELALGAEPAPEAAKAARPAATRERTPQGEPQRDAEQRAKELAEHVAAVERYNREDCVSAQALRDWLERLRGAAVREQGVDLPRPELSNGAASEEIAATAEETRRVMSDLLAGVPVDPEQRTKDQQARWLMAHLLEWHRREDKAAWWEFFRLRDLPLEDYESERSALAGLTFVGTVGGTNIRPIQRYSFPAQDHDIRKGDCVCLPFDSHDLGEVVDLDVAAHTIDIQHGGKYAAERPERVFVHRNVRPGTKPDVLLEIGRWIVANGVDAPGEHRAARDLLLKRPPRLVNGSAGLRRTEDGAIAPAAAAVPNAGGGAQVIAFGAARSAREQRIAARIGERDEGIDPEVRDAERLGFELDRGVLPIQGPPGTGKTFTGARMILELVKGGKTIGVSAVSHEAIRTLLRAVCDVAEKQGLAGFKCLHKGIPKDSNPDTLHANDSNERVADLFLHGDYSLLGGTAWLWARPEFRDSVDVLFIDEAGQMSLADVLALSAAAKSLVLLGDPQQLEQPQQASHPPGTQASALEHLLGGAKTIPAERGLFLHQTRRLHPQICAFTAEAFYENRLTSAPGLERQALMAAPGSAAERFGVAGLVYVPVEHEGNQARAQEEVDAVAAIAAALTSGDVIWRDHSGAEAPLTRADLMVVAPYNAQVTALSAALRDVRIGTVDKFQGQQAPVVIVSLTTSAPEDAPRGMDFLYSANRLNVATSRARGLCILVGNPRLFEPDCRTPQQMRLANAFCRYRELARVVQPPRTL
jgi:uncharacterized protein